MKHQFTIIGSSIIIVVILGHVLFPEVEEVHSFIIPTPPSRNHVQRRVRAWQKGSIQQKGNDNNCKFSSLYYPSSSPSSLFLHVESLHPHRDSLVTLTDPVVLPPDDDDDDDENNFREEGDISTNNNINNDNNQVRENSNDQEKEVEAHTKPFFADRRHRIAPIALGLYAFGHYLSTHTHNPIIIDSSSSTTSLSSSSSTIDGGVLFGLPNGSSIDVDPIMLGGALIAIGLLTVTWTMDEIVHIVQQYIKDNKSNDDDRKSE